MSVTTGGGTHLVLYDGECALCDGIVQFVLPRDRRHLFDFASLQSDVARAVLAPMGIDAGDLNTLWVLVDYRGPAPRALSKGRGALFVIAALGWPWRIAGVFRAIPRRILDGAYDLVARNRYRLFGQQDQCPLPSPQYRSRFIDARR